MGRDFCESQIKEQTGADIRIIPADDDSIMENIECIFCREKTSVKSVFCKGILDRLIMKLQLEFICVQRAI